jgi:anti-sigma B factor antagonist
MLNERLRRRLNPDLRLARRRPPGPAADLLTWDVRARGDLAVVAVSGELDIDSARGLEGDLAAVADVGRPLILDLAGLRFCDCAGLSLFLRVQQRARAAGGSLHLAALTPRVLRVITVARLADVLPITASVADTVAALDEAAIAAPPLPRPGDGDRASDPPLRRPGPVSPGSRRVLR